MRYLELLPEKKNIITLINRIMYISTEYKFAYLAIPRTASRTMRNWVTTEYGAVVNGNHHHMQIEENEIHKKEEISNYFVFTIIRNPYQRIISHWRWNYPDSNDADLISHFEKDITNMILDDSGKIVSGKPIRGLVAKQMHLLENAAVEFKNPIYKYRMENLEQNLSYLPFLDKPVKLADRVGSGGNKYGDWRKFYNKRVVKSKIFAYYRQDFRVLGYSKEIP